jgi:hypothetical protein
VGTVFARKFTTAGGGQAPSGIFDARLCGLATAMSAHTFPRFLDWGFSAMRGDEFADREREDAGRLCAESLDETFSNC